jgi:hypothetical protein
MSDLGALSHSYFKPASPSVKQFNQRIEGDILVSEHLLPSSPLDPRLDGGGERLCSLRSVSLFGVEFRLYDGRDLYAGEDRVSFVFCVDDDPLLDGLMVYVEDHVECLKYRDERIQRADYLLAVPNIHLRYYLETWMDSLMGWVKYHYIEDLRYWRYEDKWGSREALAERFGQFGRYEYYEMLKSKLESEVMAWTDKAVEVSNFWKAARRTPEEFDDY